MECSECHGTGEIEIERSREYVEVEVCLNCQGMGTVPGPEGDLDMDEYLDMEGDNEMKKKIFIICSVRNAGAEYKEFLNKYVQDLENSGHEVHLPHRDTNQEDPTGGYNICLENLNAIKNADEIHISYKENSQGTHFDLGVAFAFGKHIHIIHGCEVDDPTTKSFPMMIRHWEFSQH